jgi:thioredoxin-like negative regulator of GroEL
MAKTISSRKAACSLLSLLTSLLASNFQGASAAPPGYAQAQSEFQAKHYAQALNGFQTVSRANPTDANSHYYMALCYQYMNQVAQATKEYQWVATYSRDARLKAQAQAGLAQMGRYQSARSTQVASASVGSSSASGGSSASAMQSSKPSPYSRGKLKVIEFNTTWCKVCKTFDPVFDQVQGMPKYSSSVQFQRFDAEQSGNAELVERYAVKEYPTVVFADSNGKQVNRFVGGTPANSLCIMIDQSLAQLPK